MCPEKISIRKVCICVIVFLLGRVSFFEICVVPIATLILLRREDKNNIALQLILVSGLISSLYPGAGNPGGNFVKYFLICTCIICIDGLLRKQGVINRGSILTYVGAAVTFFIHIGGGVFNIRHALVFALLEAMVVCVLVCLMGRGFAWFNYGSPGCPVGNEQLISIVICITAAISGIPEILPDRLSLGGLAGVLFLLYMAYQYGVGAAAVTGTAIGLVEGMAVRDAGIAGMYCVVGICVGMAREFGRIMSAFVLIMAGVGVAIIYPDNLWDIDVLKNVLSGAVCFVLLPNSLFSIQKNEVTQNRVLTKYNYQYETSRKLEEFAGAFEKISDSFSRQAKLVPMADNVKNGEIFNELAQNVCGACTNCNYCWGQMYYDTYKAALGIIECAENTGSIRCEDISAAFVSRCIHFEDFMREANRQLELSRINAEWLNRQAENRLLIAEQMNEVSRLITRLKNEVLSIEQINLKEEKELTAGLRSCGVRIKHLSVYEKMNGRKEICIRARTDRGCIPLKDISEIISDIVKCHYRPADNMPVTLTTDYEIIVFVEEARYRLLTGTARIAKDGEELSGDNYSFINLSCDKTIMTITDGMGSGKKAFSESEAVIEMLEQLVEAGFGEDIALRFVNSAMASEGRAEIFSTVDMCIIDLNNGMCECVKCGAAATFIKKKNGVKVVNSDAMPIGIIPEINYASTCYKLNEGDYVIMVSDGVADSFPGADKEAVISKLIETADVINAGELAGYILDRARESSMYKVGDDMSVLVAGLWCRY